MADDTYDQKEMPSIPFLLHWHQLGNVCPVAPSFLFSQVLLAVLIKKQGSVTMPLICSLFILIWIPFTTNLRAKNAKKLNPIYNEEFHYMFDEWGLHLELGDDAIDVEWKKITKPISYISSGSLIRNK